MIEDKLDTDIAKILGEFSSKDYLEQLADLISTTNEIKALFNPKPKIKSHCRDCKHGNLNWGDYPCSGCNAYQYFTSKDK